MSRTAAVPTRCFGHITGSLPSADARNYLPMFTLAFEHTHRVLLTRFTGWLSSEDIVQLDRAVVAFVVRAGPVRGLLDFSGIEGITAPPPFLRCEDNRRRLRRASGASSWRRIGNSTTSPAPLPPSSANGAMSSHES